MNKSLIVHDSYQHRGMRRQLIAGLRRKGITDERVLSAMAELPRHLFLDSSFAEWAYQDKAFPIGREQTISQPYTVAYMTQLLAVEKRQKVLEIGTGSGYQAALLALLGARVYTIERHRSLYEKARSTLQELGFSGIRLYWRDGYLGLPELAPFDRILVTAGATEIPKTLRQQLAIGGIMVIPVGSDGQRMYRITRKSDQEFIDEPMDYFRFVPFVKGRSDNGD